MGQCASELAAERPKRRVAAPTIGNRRTRRRQQQPVAPPTAAAGQHIAPLTVAGDATTSTMTGGNVVGRDDDVDAPHVLAPAQAEPTRRQQVPPATPHLVEVGVGTDEASPLPGGEPLERLPAARSNPLAGFTGADDGVAVTAPATAEIESPALSRCTTPRRGSQRSLLSAAAASSCAARSLESITSDGSTINSDDNDEEDGAGIGLAETAENSAEHGLVAVGATEMSEHVQRRPERCDGGLTTPSSPDADATLEDDEETRITLATSPPPPPGMNAGGGGAVDRSPSREHLSPLLAAGEGRRSRRRKPSAAQRCDANESGGRPDRPELRELAMSLALRPPSVFAWLSTIDTVSPAPLVEA